MRLGDLDALLDKCESLYMKRHILFHGVTAYTIESAPTIDPETLPIVQDLREQLDKVTAERDAAIEDLKLIFNAGCNCRICANTDYCIDKAFIIGKCSKFLWRGI